MASETTFVGTTDGLTADNLLKPAKGEIFLLTRDDNNFAASQQTITDNLLYELAPLWSSVAVVANVAGVDMVVPTLTTRTMASNNSTTTLAKVGDVVTLTIVGSELLQEPIVTIAGHAIPAIDVVVGGTAATWTAVYTMVTGDTTGVVPFTVHAADVFGNAVAATTLSSGVGVTFDKTVPVMAAVSVVSNNGITTRAKSGDVVTATFTTSEALTANPTVTFGGQTMTFSSLTTGTYVYTRTLNGTETEGTANVLVVGTDLAGNASVSTNIGNITTDFTLPDFTTTTVVSNNATNTLAKSGDIVTATFTTSEALTANPTVTFGGQTMTFSSLTTGTYVYTRTLNGTETEGTANVLVTGTDITGNLTNGTYMGSITTDFTLPTLSSGLRVSATSYTITLSELAAAASITKANAGGFVVYETGTPATTYAVSAIAPGITNDLITITVADTSASTVAGVTITYVAGGNGTVADVTGNLLATDATGVTAAA